MDVQIVGIKIVAAEIGARQHRHSLSNLLIRCSLAVPLPNEPLVVESHM